MPAEVLFVDDEVSMLDFLRDALRRSQFSLESTSDPRAALSLIEARDFDVVVTDLNMKGMSGIDLCRQIVALRPELPVIVLTAFGSLDTAVAAIRAGAYDFLTKPVEVETLSHAIDRAAAHRALHAEVRRLRTEIEATHRFGDLLGDSPPMQRLYDLLTRVAASDASVLITGESGTGKEVVARALHQRSERGKRKGNFVAINCAALPEALLESELFGHAKSAFTDAKVARVGLFQAADGGTLFLDEIGEMPLGLQPKLLRALQERKIRPVGANAEIPVDVHVIAATNRDLEEAVEERRFREDLYFRVNVIHVELPPLRARGGDVLLLAQHFLRSFAERGGKPVTGISSPAAEKLLAYPWPGNVRELQNCMERAVALTRFDQIAVDDLSDRVRSHKSSHVVVASDDPSELVSMEEVERRYVLRVLEATGGSKLAAARILGFDRKTLYRKLERWGNRE